MKTRWLTVILIVVVLVVGFSAGYLWKGPHKGEPQKTLPSYSYLPAFNVDGNTGDILVHCYIRVPEHLALEEKMQFFVGEVSKTRFGYLPMKLTSIEELDNKRIAVIDLREPEKKTWRAPHIRPWYSSFQGSTGGGQTSTSLGLTFLQRDYTGEWLDGVQFLYNGKRIMFDHVEGLSVIKWRDTTLDAHWWQHGGKVIVE